MVQSQDIVGGLQVVFGELRLQQKNEKAGRHDRNESSDAIKSTEAETFFLSRSLRCPPRPSKKFHLRGSNHQLSYSVATQDTIPISNTTHNGHNKTPSRRCARRSRRQETQEGLRRRTPEPARRHPSPQEYACHHLSPCHHQLTLFFTAIQIKRNLIEKAKLKKEYAKQKQQVGDDTQPKRPSTYTTTEDDAQDSSEEEEDAQDAPVEKKVKTPRQSKQKRESQPELPAPAAVAEAAPKNTESNLTGIHHSRRQKIIPFAKEHRAAQRQKREAEERRAAYENSQRERAEKTEERERFRKAMAKARSGGKNGQRKLGRESTVLLDRIKRMVQQ